MPTPEAAEEEMAALLEGRAVRGRAVRPDSLLVAGKRVAYRYRLALSDAGAASDILRILRESALPLEYLLLVPGGQEGSFRAYLGLGTKEVGDLPLKLTALGVRVDRGEETAGETINAI